jgi:hypothetical protein
MLNIEALAMKLEKLTDQTFLAKGECLICVHNRAQHIAIILTSSRSLPLKLD